MSFDYSRILKFGEKILKNNFNLSLNISDINLEEEYIKCAGKTKERVIPICSVYGRCGGCSLQHSSYQNKMQKKDRKQPLHLNLTYRNSSYIF